jgi:hypothetical protein
MAMHVRRHLHDTARLRERHPMGVYVFVGVHDRVGTTQWHGA